MNVSLFIRKSNPAPEEMIGAIQQTNGQWIIPLTEHVLNADTAAHIRQYGGFVSVRKRELKAFVGRRMEDPETGDFVPVESIDAVAQLIGRFYAAQFGFDGGVFLSRGRPGEPATSGRSYRIEATSHGVAQAPVPRLQAEAPVPA